MTPPLISAPTNVAILLQLHNHDSRAHRVTLAGASAQPLTVAAGASATESVRGLKKRTYRLLVDGATRARIVIGAVPGP